MTNPTIANYCLLQLAEHTDQPIHEIRQRVKQDKANGQIDANTRFWRDFFLKMV